MNVGIIYMVLDGQHVVKGLYNSTVVWYGIRIYKEYSALQMDDLEEVIWNYRMSHLSGFKHYTKNLVPQENCLPFMDAWMKCTDTKDNCCGSTKCKFFFGEWQNCHKYNQEVRAHNAKLSSDGHRGTFNGLSAK